MPSRRKSIRKEDVLQLGIREFYRIPKVEDKNIATNGKPDIITEPLFI